MAYFVDAKPVRGREDLRLEHSGVTYLFASAANRDAFAANANRYLPQVLLHRAKARARVALAREGFAT